MDIVENIERYIAGTGLTPGTRTRLVRARDEIVRLRKNQLTPAPEQPAQQEPVAMWDGKYQIEFGNLSAYKHGEHSWIPLYTSPPAQQEPMLCHVCNQVHAILDADESQIIRNAKDGYPEGRTPRLLTLQERVAALCLYASDWKRWCLEKENTAPQPPAQPLTDEFLRKLHRIDEFGLFCDYDEFEQIARAIEAAHGIKENK